MAKPLASAKLSMLRPQHNLQSSWRRKYAVQIVVLLSCRTYFDRVIAIYRPEEAAAAAVDAFDVGGRSLHSLLVLRSMLASTS